MVLITIWWFISAHKWFKGPKVNVEHMMLGREGNIVMGEEEADFGDQDNSSGEARVSDKIHVKS